MSDRGPTELAGSPKILARRVCPLCDAMVDKPRCPHDGMSTLSLDAPRSDPERLQAGMLIADRYRIERLIGSGGFAKVFSAVHTGTGQNVALKVLGSGGGLDDQQALRRFFREARACAGLKHPNTVRVFDFGQEDDGIVFLAMELLTGRTLRALHHKRMTDKNPFSEVEALEIALAVCQSLAEAHSMGMVHRDIGPSNVFLHEVSGSNPVVKLLDFGLVKDDRQPLTRANQLFGTVPYMSPEQVLRQTVTPRSDLYSLGIMLWWMLVGGQPFIGAEPREVMWCHVHAPLPRLREHARTPVSAALEEVVARASAKDPLARFENALALRGELEACLNRARELVRSGSPAQLDATRELHFAPTVTTTRAITRAMTRPTIPATPASRRPARPPNFLIALCVTAMITAVVSVVVVSARFRAAPKPTLRTAKISVPLVPAPSPIVGEEREMIFESVAVEDAPPSRARKRSRPRPANAKRAAMLEEIAPVPPISPSILKERI